MLRLGTAAIALIACAWFVVGVRQAHDLARATAIADRSPLPARVAIATARRELDTAGWLNPDTEGDLVRAKLDVDAGNYAAARRVIGRVVADEPQNARAWLALARSSHGDPRAFFTAVIQLRALVPPVRAR